MNLKMKNFPLILLITTLFAGGCNWFDKSPDVSDIEVNFELIAFYEDLFSISPDSVEAHIPQFRAKYGKYLNAYSEGVIRIGHPEDDEYADNLSQFIAYEPNQEVVDTCQKVFSDKKALKNELAKAFRHYKNYYPQRDAPDVYLHISGFNQSIAVDSGWVSVSVEKYLGRDNIFYQWLETPKYLRNQMDTERVVPDVMKAIAMTEYAYNDSIDDLISQMIYHGKILQFVKHTIPEVPDTLLFGYTQKEMEWCRKNEELMWSTLVEQKHLFATDHMLVRKYVGEAPFTSFFGQESPGRAGRYLGYKIMEAWMENHSEKTFRDMMQVTDPHRVLSRARYRP